MTDTHKAQPEQKPVAVVDANDEGYWADILPDQNVKVGQFLYTIPPQRTWVGLTDVDRQEAFESMPDMLDGFLKKWGWLHLSKAIEAKLKEKNT